MVASLSSNRCTHILQSYVKDQLEEHRKSDAEQYLKNLYDLYTRYFYIDDELIVVDILL